MDFKCVYAAWLLLLLIAASKPAYPQLSPAHASVADASAMSALSHTRQAAWYLRHGQEERADSAAFVALSIIAESGNRRMLLQAYDLYFQFVPANCLHWPRQAETFSRLAAGQEDDYFIVRSEMALAALACDDRNAHLEHATAACLAASRGKTDVSLRIEAQLLLADAQSDMNRQSQKLEACRNYLRAVHLADSIENKALLAVAYSCLANFYYSLDDYETALEYRRRQLEALGNGASQQQVMHIKIMRARDYSGWKKYDDAARILDEVMQYARVHNDSSLRVGALQLFSSMYLDRNEIDKLEKLYSLDSGWELRRVQLAEPSLYYRLMAYFEAGHRRPASARRYFDSAESRLPSDAYSTSKFYERYGSFLMNNGDRRAALIRYRKAYSSAASVDYIPFMLDAARSMEAAFAGEGRSDSAYFYNQRSSELEHRQSALSNEKELMRLDAAAEESKQRLADSRRERLAAQQLNIEYLTIFISFFGFFITLLYLTSVKLNPKVARSISFVTFLLLFELVNMVLHHWLDGHSSSLEERPFMLLAIKVAIAAAILWLHHKTEESVMRYITRHPVFRFQNGPPLHPHADGAMAAAKKALSAMAMPPAGAIPKGNYSDRKMSGTHTIA